MSDRDMARTTRHIATRLALALAGAGLAVSGVVLTLRAVWIAVSVALGPMWASAILGGVLLLIGALVLGLSTRSSRRPAASDDDLIVRITTAFFQGLAAGRSEHDR